MDDGSAWTSMIPLLNWDREAIGAALIGTVSWRAVKLTLTGTRVYNGRGFRADVILPVAGSELEWCFAILARPPAVRSAESWLDQVVARGPSVE